MLWTCDYATIKVSETMMTNMAAATVQLERSASGGEIVENDLTLTVCEPHVKSSNQLGSVSLALYRPRME